MTYTEHSILLLSNVLSTLTWEFVGLIALMPPCVFSVTKRQYHNGLADSRPPKQHGLHVRRIESRWPAFTVAMLSGTGPVLALAMRLLLQCCGVNRD